MNGRLDGLMAAAISRAPQGGWNSEPAPKLRDGGEFVERYSFELDDDGVLRPQWFRDPFTGEAIAPKCVVWQAYEWHDRMGGLHIEWVPCADQQAACNRVAELKALPKPKPPRGWAA